MLQLISESSYLGVDVWCKQEYQECVKRNGFKVLQAFF